MAIKISELPEDFFRTLAHEYLQYGETMAGLARKHRTSPETISKILYTGIVKSIIDDVSAEAIVEKAIRNTTPYETMKTRRHWEEALQLRKRSILIRELDFLRRRKDELNFQLGVYDDFFYNEEETPSKENMQNELALLEQEISSIEHLLEG